ncbi:MAG: small ribosomal subunit Rsm22 family protein [Lachnospiraceae bacterium]|nr:small ribosomal subunit Rsm22 family protein [Lachnospiraceae bacterium]
MELPNYLKNASEKLIEGMNINAMSQSARELSRRYMEESGQGKSLLNRDEEAAVYSLMRMPATFSAVSFALEKVCEMSDFVPRSLLDAGAGTGGATFAANEFFALDSITCLEREPAMENIGKKLFSFGEDKAIREARYIRADLVEEATKANDNSKKYVSDLVISSYVLNEMSMEDRMKVVKWLWDNAEKMLVIIEPGTPVGFANIRRIRDFLMEQGAYVCAPCPHMENCPVTGDDWCHFTVRVQRGKIHKMLKNADVPYEDEKFSYIAFSREPLKMDKCGRIMRHPITLKGRVELSICTSDGIYTKTVTKKDNEAYKCAKKVDCGDIYPFI